MTFARPHRQAKSNTTSRLSGLQPDDRRNRQRPGFRRDIAPLSASFAEETRQARTHVRNWSGDDCKARGSKQDRSVSRRREVGTAAGEVNAVQSQIDVVADFAVGLGIFFI